MGVYKKLFAYVPEKKYLAVVSMFFSLLAAALTVMPFWYLWKFLRELMVSGNVDRAIRYAIIIAVLMLAHIFIYFFSLWASHLLAFRLETNLRKTGIRHLLSGSFAFYDMNRSGNIRKIIDDNAAQTHMIVAHLIPDLTGAIAIPAIMYILMFMVDYKLGILLIVLTVIGLVQMKLMMGGQEFMKTYMKSLERLNAESVEYVRGMQVVKIFRNTVMSFKSFYDAIVTYSRYALEYSRSCRRPFVIFQVLFNVVIVLIIPVTIYYINGGGDLDLILAKTVFFACFAGSIFACFMRVMYVGMYQFQAMEVINKLEGLFHEMQEGKPLHGSIENMKNTDIEFDDVSFGYDRDEVLSKLSFKLKGNKTYALVGASGSGKSTIAKLISGFYKLNGGRILIGDIPLEDYSEKAISANIAFVFQNSKLFKTDIYENVAMGNPTAGREKVLEALSEARCDEILDKFPERENTVIGSKGVHLSGGEIQRIAIARAILKDAPIIILDEASAAADPENEYEIQRAFSSLMKDKTVIMIAHRLTSIRNVDEILVVDRGKIIERGTDEELMKLNGKYAMLQNMFRKANDWRVYD